MPCEHVPIRSLPNNLNKGLFAAAYAREKGRKKSSGGAGGIDFTGTCRASAHFQFRHFGRASLRPNHAAGSHRYQAYHDVVHFQLQCRRLSPSLAYSLSLRSPWAQTGEENHVLHNYHYCCNTFILLHFTEPKCRF